MMIRRKTGTFNKAFDETVDKTKVRAALADAFISSVQGQNANILTTWHGLEERNLDAVLKMGLAALQTTDQGFWCKGIYSTTSPEYACFYSTGEIESDHARPDGCVLLCLSSVGLAYPVCRKDYANGPKCTLEGGAILAPCDMHVAVVNPDEGYQAASDPTARGCYLEVAIEQESQILPLAVVYFERV